jgi:hypothetical protein
MADIAEFLLKQGDQVTPSMVESVKRIGKDFEFYRAGFSEDMLAETEAGLAKLYGLFRVEPVAKRKVHDGTSPIAVPEGEWYVQDDALWQFLVPGHGSAQTIQGETIRISGKLAREIMDNGGANWDGDFRKMLSALVGYFGMGSPLAPKELEEAARIAALLKNGSGDDEPERLMELAVHWVKANPNPFPLSGTEYKR